MTLALRLLRGYVGASAAREVALASNGFWNDIPDPKSVTAAGVTYFGYVNDSGDLYVAGYTHSTGVASTPYLVGSGFVSPSGPIHNSIALLVRQSDARILIVETAEGGQPLRNLSTNPSDVTAFGSAAAILDAGAYTYCSLTQLSGESGAIYYWGTHFSGGIGRLAYAKSTDGGATWGSTHDVVSPVSTAQIYHRVGSDQATVQHLFFTSTDRAIGTPSSVYHCYMSGGSFYKSDGTLIGASQPFAASAATLVQGTGLGSARCEGWAIDSLGRPAAIINIRDGSSTELVRVARFDGASWTTHAVADSAGQLISSAGMVKDNANRVYIPRLVSGALEMFQYDSYDEGVTWTGLQLTSGSLLDNDAPDTPLNASGLRALWGYGTYTGPAFSFDVKGWAG